MYSATQPSHNEDLKRLEALVQDYAECTQSPVGALSIGSGIWLNRITYVLTNIASATRTEYLSTDLPTKPIAGTLFRTVPININVALAEGREGIVGLVGNGEEFVFTTLTTSFRTFVTEDSTKNSALPRTLQFARELTSLRRRALHRRILLEKEVG
jgi:hypothetical protein